MQSCGMRFNKLHNIVLLSYCTILKKDFEIIFWWISPRSFEFLLNFEMNWKKWNFWSRLSEYFFLIRSLKPMFLKFWTFLAEASFWTIKVKRLDHLQMRRILFYFSICLSKQDFWVERKVFLVEKKFWYFISQTSISTKCQ